MQCSFTELKNLIFTAGLGSNIEVGICDEISDAVNTVILAIQSGIPIARVELLDETL